MIGVDHEAPVHLKDLTQCTADATWPITAVGLASGVYPGSGTVQHIAQLSVNCQAIVRQMSVTALCSHGKPNTLSGLCEACLSGLHASVLPSMQSDCQSTAS